MQRDGALRIAGRGRLTSFSVKYKTARRVARQLGRSDCEEVLGPVDPRDVICMKTRLRTPSTDQSTKRPPHRKKCTRTANCFIGRPPGTAEWNQVVFSDESRISLSSDDNRVHVWRPRGERLNLAFALPRQTASTAGVMVWGVITYSTRSHFQQDNARPHTVRVSQDCLRTVTTLSWPARSPDLSPIEQIWDHLGRQVEHSKSLNELEVRLQQIWNEMSQDIIQNLYASMPDHIASCIRARGDSTGPQVVIDIIEETKILAMVLGSRSSVFALRKPDKDVDKTLFIITIGFSGRMSEHFQWAPQFHALTRLISHTLSENSNSKGTATAGSDVVQSGRPIFDDFFQHLWPYIGNNTANVVFQMIKRLWLIRIDQ
ncbi:transposable element Tcb2 transposase [Trichonephila clavipes]|nr:transposable element Tcb2 transposase [Trichonephila clavipes]